MRFKNSNELELLTESSLGRIVQDHENGGYAIVSASRHDCLEGIVENPTEEEIFDENNRRATKLQNELTYYGYSYVPVYGGYKENGSDRATIEKSFIVFPFNYKTKEPIDFEQFQKNILNLGRFYQQDAVLIKRPNENPRYFIYETNSWDDTSFKSTKLNDVTQQYFTALKSWQDISLNKGNKKWQGNPKRFTYIEAYLNKAPQTIMGAHSRANSGEMFSMKHFTKTK